LWVTGSFIEYLKVIAIGMKTHKWKALERFTVAKAVSELDANHEMMSIVIRPHALFHGRDANLDAL
jgi:hypothetical protein